MSAAGCGSARRQASQVQALSTTRPEILFTRSAGSDARPNLYAMASDGSRQRLFAPDAAQAAMSPDDDRIAFVRGGAIWVMQRDSSGQRELTKPSAPPAVADSGPAWSTDGRSIYFSRFTSASETSSLFRINSDGTGFESLTQAKPTDHGHCQDNPSASPTRQVIVFEETFDCEHSSDLALTAATTTGRPAKLSFSFPDYETSTIQFDPSWAPDRPLLAYAVLDMESWPFGVGRSGIYVSSSDGSPPRRISAAIDVSTPAWSPDGAWVAFTRAIVEPSTYPGDIWLVRRDGAGAHQLTHGKSDDRDPVWVPPPR